MMEEHFYISDEKLKLWLALLKCPQFGVVSFLRLKALLPEPTDVFALPATELIHYGLTEPQIAYFRRPDWQYIERLMAWMHSHRVLLVPYGSPHYPELLASTARPPVALFVKGQLNLLQRPQIAFVGSRNPSHYGKQVTQYLIQQLASTQVCITSGLAIGIDGLAHKAALQSDCPTIAVLGSGFQHLYPKRHVRLADEIAENGLLITEFLPDVPPIQHNFPRRNRIIAGLTNGTVVVEAAIKSGSLITAQFSLEEGRDVFAVPGNIFNPLSAGTHHLIQQGAKLISSAADIVEDYLSMPVSQSVTKNHLAGSKLLASVDHDTTPVDVIVQRSNLPVDQVLTELLDLEVQGAVAAVPGGYIKVAT
mgnify:CR=1 FL=1